MGNKKSKSFISGGYYNLFRAKGMETPDIYKDADEYLTLYYDRARSLNIKLSSISLLNDGFWLFELGDDLVDSDGVCEIPDGINYINTRCCSLPNNIKKIILPPSLIEIKDYAFSFMDDLKEIEFSYGVKTLGNPCFQSQKTTLTTINFPGSIKIFKPSNFGIFKKFEYLKFNYGTELCLVHVPANIKELWIPPTMREIRTSDSFYFKEDEYINLRKIYVFKGDIGWKYCFRYPDKIKAEIIEVEDGWGNWRENALNDLDSKIYKHLLEIQKLERRFGGNEDTQQTLNFRVEKVNLKIEKLLKEKEYIQGLIYE